MSGNYDSYSDAVKSSASNTTSRTTSSYVPFQQFSSSQSTGLVRSTISKFDDPSSVTPYLTGARPGADSSRPKTYLSDSISSYRVDPVTPYTSSGIGSNRRSGQYENLYPKAPDPPDPHSPLNTFSYDPSKSKWDYGDCHNCAKHTLVRQSDSNCVVCAGKLEDLMKPCSTSSPAVTAQSQIPMSESKSDPYRFETSPTSSSSNQPSRTEPQLVSSTASWTRTSPQSQPQTSNSSSMNAHVTAPYISRELNPAPSVPALERDKEAAQKRRKEQQQQPNVMLQAPSEFLPPIEVVPVPRLRKWPTPEQFDRNRLLDLSSALRQLYETYKKLVCLRGNSSQPQPGAEHANSAEKTTENARQLVICPELLKLPLASRLLSPDWARFFLTGLLSWLAEVDALAVAFDPVTPDECPWQAFEKRFPHALRLPSLARFEHLLHRLELHMCLLILRGPFVPEMAQIDANSPLLLELRALFPKSYKQLLESVGYEASEERTSEEPSAFASDGASALSSGQSRYDPYSSQFRARGRFAVSESETLSAQQPGATKPILILEEREVELLSRVRECFELRADKMGTPSAIERAMHAWLALAFDCFTLRELVRTAAEMRLSVAKACADLEGVPRDHPLNAVHHCRTSLYLLLMLAMGLAKPMSSGDDSATGAGSGSGWMDPKHREDLKYRENLNRGTCDRYLRLRLNFGQQLFQVILSIIVDNPPQNFSSQVIELYNDLFAKNKKLYAEQCPSGESGASAAASSSSDRKTAKAGAPVDSASAAASASTETILRAQYMQQQRAHNTSGAARASRSNTSGSTAETDPTIGVLSTASSSTSSIDNAKDVNRGQNRPLPPLRPTSSPQDAWQSVADEHRGKRASQDVRQHDAEVTSEDDQDSLQNEIEVVDNADASSDFSNELPEPDLSRVDAGADTRTAAARPVGTVKSAPSTGSGSGPASSKRPAPATSTNASNRTKAQQDSFSTRNAPSTKTGSSQPSSTLPSHSQLAAASSKGKASYQTPGKSQPSTPSSSSKQQGRGKI